MSKILKKGQIVTLREPVLERSPLELEQNNFLKLVYHDSNMLYNAVLKEAQQLGIKFNSVFLRAKIIETDYHYDGQELLRVEWLYPFSSDDDKRLMGVGIYMMKEEEFMEYYNHSVSFNLNSETQLSFTSTKLIANQITNSKEMENFLLIN